MKRKWLRLIVLVAAIFSLHLTVTYGLFESSKDISMEADLANFNIFVNNDLIGDITTFTVDTFNYLTDSESASGKLAPGCGLYFDIKIDPSDTEVSFRYDVTFDFSNITNEMITVDSVTAGSVSLTRTDEFTYSGIIMLEDITGDTTDDVTITITISWTNDDDNNEIDYQTMESGNIEIPVSVKFTQYLGEALEEYTGTDEPVLE